MKKNCIFYLALFLFLTTVIFNIQYNTYVLFYRVKIHRHIFFPNNSKILDRAKKRNH